ncbi:hypothetical protein CDIK_0911 [Cucumispora dikerogammari]|nr:hypothetical protein CDIK_0911 [Cucumispora dikerogammari]
MTEPRVQMSIEIEGKHINTNTIDCFTSVSLEDIMIECFKENNDFIIARVKSTPLCLKKASYYQYYWANSFNRIVFKRNPLTNRVTKYTIKNPIDLRCILGDVDYFKIKRNQNVLFYALTGKNRYLKPLTENNAVYITEKENETGEEKISIQLKATYFATELDFINNIDCREYFKKNLNSGELNFLYDTNISKVNSNIVNKVDIEEEYWKHKKIVNFIRFLYCVSIIMICLVVCLALFPDYKGIVAVSMGCTVLLTIVVGLYIYFYMKKYIKKLQDNIYPKNL